MRNDEHAPDPSVPVAAEDLPAARDPAGSAGIEAVRALVRQETRRLSHEETAAGPWGAFVWEELAGLLDGGKHLRARTVLAVHEAAGAPSRSAAVRVAAAIEALHGAFLLHDDVIDGDLVRRGRPNLIGLAVERARAEGLGGEEAGRWGCALGILAGDLSIALAHRLLGEAALPAPQQARLRGLLARAVSASVVGEMGDVALEAGLLRAGPAPVRAVARAKTAVYTAACPLALGAVTGGLSEQETDALWRAGERLGTAYQVIDDLREVGPDRSRRTDLRRGAVTSVISHARSHRDWDAVAHLWGEPGLDEAGAMVLRGFLRDSGACDAAAREAREMLAAARRETLGLPLPVQRVVRGLAREVEELLVQSLEPAEAGPEGDAGGGMSERRQGVTR